jgi:uncharacterized protein YhbP (UPF0306 family)
VTHEQQLFARAKAIIGANRYMTLATADDAGRPWASPVWYATDDYRRFYWVSSPEARHSQNVAARPEVAIVVFDSQVPVGGAQAVYMRGHAVDIRGDKVEDGVEIFSRRSREQGLHAWTRDDVQAPAPLRLYCATVYEHSILTAGDERVVVRLE